MSQPLELVPPPRETSPAVAPTPSEGCLAAQFRCRLSCEGTAAAWIMAAGDLDVAGAPQLARTVDGALACARLVVLDLRRLTFLDGAGVGVIVSASTSARRAGGRVLLISAPAELQRVFTLTGTAERLEVFDLGAGIPPVQVLLDVARDERETVPSALAAEPPPRAG